MRAIDELARQRDNLVVKILTVIAVLGGGILLVTGLLVFQAVSGFSITNFVTGVFALDSTQLWWYVSRSAGIMAYLLFWLSTLWGLGISSKIFDTLLERQFTFDFHEHLSLLSLGFVGLHIVVLLFDRFRPFSLAELLIPFFSAYRRLWVGVGMISLYLALLVTVTFYMRSKISQKTFRTIHYLSLAAYVGGMLHGLFAGTDAAQAWMQILVWSTFLSIVFFATFWLVMKLKN